MVFSLKPYCCQRTHSLAQEGEVQPWLEATFVLPGASPHCTSAQAMICKVLWRWQGGWQPVHWHKGTYTLFLLWRIPNVGDCACWRCVRQPPHWAALDLLFLDTWKMCHRMPAAEPHAVGHLYVQPPMCCGEKSLSVCSASQEQTSSRHGGSSAP